MDKGKGKGTREEDFFDIDTIDFNAPGPFTPSEAFLRQVAADEPELVAMARAQEEDMEIQRLLETAWDVSEDDDETDLTKPQPKPKAKAKSKKAKAKTTGIVYRLLIEEDSDYDEDNPKKAKAKAKPKTLACGARKMERADFMSHETFVEKLRCEPDRTNHERMLRDYIIQRLNHIFGIHRRNDLTVFYELIAAEFLRKCEITMSFPRIVDRLELFINRLAKAPSLFDIPRTSVKEYFDKVGADPDERQQAAEDFVFMMWWSESRDGKKALKKANFPTDDMNRQESDRKKAMVNNIRKKVGKAPNPVSMEKNIAKRREGLLRSQDKLTIHKYMRAKANGVPSEALGTSPMPRMRDANAILITVVESRKKIGILKVRQGKYETVEQLKEHLMAVFSVQDKDQCILSHDNGGENPVKGPRLNITKAYYFFNSIHYYMRRRSNGKATGPTPSPMPRKQGSTIQVHIKEDGIDLGTLNVVDPEGPAQLEAYMMRVFDVEDPKDCTLSHGSRWPPIEAEFRFTTGTA